MTFRGKAVMPLLVALSAFAFQLPFAEAKGTRDAAALAAMKAFAGTDSGVLVWQSRRTSRFRIFACALDGTNLRQISPDVAGKDHLAPLLSPDGAKLIYYQTNTLTDGSYYSDHVGQMMLVNSSATLGTAKKLVDEVRTYFECRFARWIDDNTIAYIGKDHATYAYTLSTGASAKLFAYPFNTFGAIPNRQRTWAVDGKNRIFQIQNPGPSGTLSQKKDLDGCEGNLSNDGLWIYRVQATSHDLPRVKLGTWEEEIFFQNHDSALPSGQNYIYFPQLSLNERYLAIGASPNSHDHYTSDYDIYLIAIDPKTFKKTGAAVKYSFSSSLDSYPDVWIGALAPALSAIEISAATHILQAKAKMTLKATLKDASGKSFPAIVTWSVSGGGSVAPTTSTTPVGQTTTTFTSDGTPGAFTVTARADGVQSTFSITVVDPSVPFKINCGSNDHDVSGWLRDDSFVQGGGDWTNPNTVDTSGVPGAAPPEVYKSVRHTSPHSYSFPLPNGVYRLKLHFADAYADRKMNYTVEGISILQNFDITTKAGKNKAWIESFEITVKDGNGLQIEASGTDDVFEAGLEIETVSVTPPADAGSLKDAGASIDTGKPSDGSPKDLGTSNTDMTPKPSPTMVGSCGLNGPSREQPTSPPWILFLLLGLVSLRRHRRRP